MKEISIIIPVYNALPHFEKCIDSLLEQTCDKTKMEILLVDDGSTDGSAQACEDYAETHPELFRVFHKENSGGPAAPRNIGIKEAVGNNVFFCDNDDYFGPEAIERMLNHVNEWSPDVLLVKMGETGRKGYPRSMFESSNPNIDLYSSTISRTLGPWKLFRREFLLANAIQFPEDCAFDDSIFTMKAYIRANKISVAADYDYYYWAIRDSKDSLSDGGGSPKSSWKKLDNRLLGIRRLFELIEQDADKEKAGILYHKVLSDPAYNTLVQLSKTKSGEQKDFFLEAQKTIGSYLCHGDTLPFNKKFTLSSMGEVESPNCLGIIRGSIESGIFKEYSYEVDTFCCDYSIRKKLKCKRCDKYVQEEFIRINANSIKENQKLSKRQKKEIKWAEAQVKKKKLFSSFGGRVVIRISRMPLIKSRIRPLVRKTSNFSKRAANRISKMPLIKSVKNPLSKKE